MLETTSNNPLYLFCPMFVPSYLYNSCLMCVAEHPLLLKPSYISCNTDLSIGYYVIRILVTVPLVSVHNLLRGSFDK